MKNLQKFAAFFLVLSFVGFNTSVLRVFAEDNGQDNVHHEDVCQNIDGDQEEAPEGYQIKNQNDRSECVPKFVTVKLCKADDHEHMLSGWTLTLKGSKWNDDDEKKVENNEQNINNNNENDNNDEDENHGYSGVTGNDGCVSFTHVKYGNYKVGEVMKDGWTQVSLPNGDGNIQAYNLNQTFTVVNHHDLGSITVTATKVVCDAERYLPNMSGGADITATTATDYVAASNGKCHIEPNWQFQYRKDNNANAPVGTFIGEAPGYQTFNAGTPTVIPLTEANVGLREVLKDGYIPFSDGNDVSAEFWCASDVLYYDNNDVVYNAVPGHSYNCVAFNAPKVEAPVCNPDVNLIQNGGFEAPVLSNPSWSIIPDSDTLLKWLVAWTTPTPSSGTLGLEIQNHVAGSPFAGNQHAELDGDHPVTIWQNITTIPGKAYSLSFKYSPRPGVADNKIKVKLDGADLGAELNSDGSTNGDTVWQTITRTFNATGATAKIEFTDTSADNSLGGYLDNVDLRCTGDACNPEASQTVVSDTTAKVDNHNAVLVSNPNVAWTSISGASWIWDQDPTSNTQASSGDTKVFTKTFTVVGTPSNSSIDFAVDNGYDIKVNGNEVCADAGEFNYGSVHTCAIPAGLLVTGLNTLSISVTNLAIANSTGAGNPAGVIFKLNVHNNECVVPPPPVVHACSDKIDNDQDGMIDEADPACHSDHNVNNHSSYTPNADTEINGDLALCSDGKDNDLDEKIDSNDPACHVDGDLEKPWTPEGTTEVTPVTPPAQCSDGIDNDGDQLIDANDPGCHDDNNINAPYNPNDNSESNSTSGGGGGGGDNDHRNGGHPTGGSGGGRVLGASTSCGIYVDKFLRRGYKNDTDAVKKLQKFLNDYMNAGLKEDGNFDSKTEKALKKFQTKHSDKILSPWGFKAPTGIFYLTTQTQVNNIMCPELNLQIPPLTPIEQNPLAPKRD